MLLNISLAYLCFNIYFFQEELLGQGQGNTDMGDSSEPLTSEHAFNLISLKMYPNTFIFLLYYSKQFSVMIQQIPG